MRNCRFFCVQVNYAGVYGNAQVYPIKEDTTKISGKCSSSYNNAITASFVLTINSWTSATLEISGSHFGNGEGFTFWFI